MKRLADPALAATEPVEGHGPWHANLALGFSDDGGVTRLTDRRHAGPLRVQKPLYPEDPSVCHAIVVHPPGGVVGGDRLSIAVDVGDRAQALLTTPGAAKWYRANGHRSGQDIHLRIGAGAALEWLPQETIFFDQAEVQLVQRIDLATDAVFLGWDTFCFGRTASGEIFNSGAVTQRTEIRRDGKLIWFEQGALAGGSADMSSPLSMAGHSVCATLIAVGKPLPAALLQTLREAAAAFTPESAMHFGATQLKSVFVARWLGDSSETARRVMTTAWRHLRPHLLGREATVPRIWNT